MNLRQKYSYAVAGFCLAALIVSAGEGDWGWVFGMLICIVANVVVGESK